MADANVREIIESITTQIVIFNLRERPLVLSDAIAVPAETDFLCSHRSISFSQDRESIRMLLIDPGGNSREKSRGRQGDKAVLHHLDAVVTVERSVAADARPASQENFNDSK
jgi:hypothetical protein